MKTKKLQRIAEQEAVRSQFDGEIKVEKTSQKPHFSGCIDTLTLSKITIGANPAYRQQVEEEGLEEKLGVNAEEEIVRGIAQHEINHKGRAGLKGCPRNIDYHARKVLEPVGAVFKEKDIPDQMIDPLTGQSLYAYFANLFEDWVDNSENASVGDSLGEWLFYRDVGNNSQREYFAPLYEAFIRVQLMTYGDKTSWQLMRPFLTKNEKVEGAVTNFLQRTKISRKADYNHSLDKKVQKKVVKKISNARKWKKLARIMTEEFSELMETPIEPFMFLPLMGQNEFEEEMKKEETKMKLAHKEYQDDGEGEDEDDGMDMDGGFADEEGDGEGEEGDYEDLEGMEKEGEEKKGKSQSQRGKGSRAGRGGEYKPPSYMDNYEALDLVYKRLARGLEIKVRAHTREEQLPITYYGTKEFDPRKDRKKKLKPYVDSEGEMRIGVGQHPYHVNVSLHRKPIGLPGIQFVMLDTSGSMQEELSSNGKVMNPWSDNSHQWTDTCKYHYALLSWYGLLELLKRHGTLKKTNVKFANFSRSTYLSENLESAKKSALNPQFGGTNLSMDTIDSIFSKQGMLTMTMTDGDITNWSSIRDEFIDRAKKNHYFHIQIGGYSRFARDLEEAGLPVYYDDGSNVAQLVVDLTTPVVTKYANGKKKH